jgi:S1-C subfamily serine protease
MKVARRARVAGVAAAMAAVIGGTGFAGKDPGQNVTITVHRGGQRLTVQVTLGGLPGG